MKLLTSLSSLSVEVATGTSAKYERLISMGLCEASIFSSSLLILTYKIIEHQYMYLGHGFEA